MALFVFTRKILAGEPIDVYNYGEHRRDFTYIDDIVEGVVRVLDTVPSPDPHWTGDHPDPASSRSPWKLYNIGRNTPVPLMLCIEILEGCLQRKAKKNLLPLQAGDMRETCAEIDDLVRDMEYRPDDSLRGWRWPVCRVVQRLL